jgi:hypothetical protein
VGIEGSDHGRAPRVAGSAPPAKEISMKTVVIAACAASVAMLVAACADEDEHYRADEGYYAAAGPVGYDGYYDDYYGPFYDGYWGGDGVFYYSTGPDHHMQRDEGHHFRRNSAEGFHPVHGHTAAGPPHEGEGERH